MTVTSSGLKCDVCGGFILPFFDDEYENFSVKGIQGLLHCHLKCGQEVRTAGSDWHLLPEGPLRRAFVAADASGAVTQGEGIKDPVEDRPDIDDYEVSG